MSIQIRCICTWEGKVNDSLAGKKIRCPDCGGTLQVPAAGAVAPVTVRAPAQPPAPAPAPTTRTSAPVPPPQPAAASKPAGLGAQSPLAKPVPAAVAPKAPPAAAAAEATKACPFCAETIRAAAVKCRFCGESLDGASGKKKKSKSAPAPEETYATDDFEIPFDDYADAGNPFAPPSSHQSPRTPARRGMVGASPFGRLGARILDSIIGMIATVPGYILIFIGAPDAQNDPSVLFAGFGLLGVGLLAVLIINIILLCSGKTIGKKVMSLTVHSWETGRPAGFGISFLREIIPSLAGVVPFLGLIFVLADVFFIFRDDRRRIVDLMCKTVVLAD